MEDKNTPISSQRVYKTNAMAELEIIKAESTKSVSERIPELRNVALLLLFVLFLSVFSRLCTSLLSSSGISNQGVLTEFINSYGFIGIAFLIIQLMAILIMVNTKQPSIARSVIILAGISIAFKVFAGMASLEIGPTLVFSFTELLVNIFILRRIYETYQKI